MTDANLADACKPFVSKYTRYLISRFEGFDGFKHYDSAVTLRCDGVEYGVGLKVSDFYKLEQALAAYTALQSMRNK